jgi:hypothetical protein
MIEVQSVTTDSFNFSGERVVDRYDDYLGTKLCNCRVSQAEGIKFFSRDEVLRWLLDLRYVWNICGR